VLADQLLKLIVRDLASAEGLDGQRQRVRHTNRVGDLQFEANPPDQPPRHSGDVAGHICGGAVYFGAVLARERATTMTGNAAVGVNDDSCARQTRVAEWTTRNEAACRVDVDSWCFHPADRRGSWA